MTLELWKSDEAESDHSVQTRSPSTIQAFTNLDVDQATSMGRAYFYDVHITPLRDHVPFDVDLTLGTFGIITAGIVGYRAEARSQFESDGNAYHVSIPISGNLSASLGNTEFVSTPETAAIFGPVRRGWMKGFSTGTERVLLLKFDRASLEAELGRLLGRDDVSSINFAPMLDLRSELGGQWVRMARTIADSLETGDGLMSNPLFAAQFSSAVMGGLLLASNHNYSDQLDSRTRPVRPPAIQRAADFIESHAHEPLTTPIIASAVGASMRTLQRGFVEHFGISPGRYLARVRMERAHCDLIAGTRDTTSVSDIAQRWGFTNHGRFSAHYRRLYGRSPLTTLSGR